MTESFQSGGVLVVDDEPDLLTLYELTLLREGHEVETAASVADAWALLQQRVYRLVITDMRLPDGSGLELMHRLEVARRPEKIIVITSASAWHGCSKLVSRLITGTEAYLA